MAKVRLTEKTLNRKPPPAKEKYMELWDTILPGFGLRIGHGGRRAFMLITRVNGRQRRFTLGTYPGMTLAKARETARSIMRDAAQGVDPKEREAKARRENERKRQNTFRAVAEEFMQDHAKGLRTKGEMQRKLDKDILPEWGDRPISEITRADVKELLRKKARTSPVAANRMLALIGKIFNWALDEEIITASPAVRIKTEPEVARDRVLNEEELREVWKACDQLGYPFGPLIQFLTVTAQRRGEVASMRWSEIENSDWKIPSERTKGGAGHLVPLSPIAIDILQTLPRFAGGDFVFTTTDGDKAVSGWSKIKRRLDKLMNEAREKEGLPEVPEWHVHDLRRTAATGMRGLGIDRLIVSKVLNHAEGGITRVYDRYAADPEKRYALEAWAQRLQKIIEPLPVGGVVLTDHRTP